MAPYPRGANGRALAHHARVRGTGRGSRPMRGSHRSRRASARVGVGMTARQNTERREAARQEQDPGRVRGARRRQPARAHRLRARGGQPDRANASPDARSLRPRADRAPAGPGRSGRERASGSEDFGPVVREERGVFTAWCRHRLQRIRCPVFAVSCHDQSFRRRRARDTIAALVIGLRRQDVGAVGVRSTCGRGRSRGRARRRDHGADVRDWSAAGDPLPVATQVGRRV
jgi:hypothetical protein